MSTARNCIRYSGSDFLASRRCTASWRAGPGSWHRQLSLPTHAVAPSSWLDQTRGVASDVIGAAPIERPWDRRKEESSSLSSLAFDAKSRALKVQRQCGMFTGETVDQVTERLENVLALLPGLAARMSFHSPHDLAKLMKDSEQLAHSLTKLSELFPGQNVGELIIDDVKYAQKTTIDTLPEKIERIKEQLELTDIAAVFRRRPLLLEPDTIQEALDDLESRLPSKIDAARMLLEMPCLIYPMNRVMLPQHLME